MVEKEELLDLLVVLLNPRDYPLSEIFRDIFRLVFKPLPLSTSSLSSSLSGSSESYVLSLWDVFFPFEGGRGLLLQEWYRSIWQYLLEGRRV